MKIVVRSEVGVKKAVLYRRSLIAIDACMRLSHCGWFSAAGTTFMTATSPVQQSMKCPFSQVSLHHQPHNTLLYQPECFLSPDEQSTRPETRKRKLTFEASNGDTLLPP
jgi:hypothetical protein